MKARLKPLLRNLRQGLYRLLRLPAASAASNLEDRLTQAIRKRDYQRLRILLHKHKNLKSFSGTCGSIPHLVYRLTDCDLTSIRFVLEQGVGFLSRDSYGCTLLDTAVIEGRLELCRLLLAECRTLLTTNPQGYTTPMHKAIQYNQEAILELFLDHLEQEHTNLDMITDALYEAVRQNKPELVALISRYELDLDKRYENNATIIHFAPSTEILTLLIERGFDVGTRDEFNSSLLSRHVMDGRLEMVKTLLDLKPEIADDTAYSEAVMVACKNENIPLLSELIQHGSTENDYRDWILCHAVEERCSIETLKFLADNGALIDGRNYHNQTPLMLAAQKNNPYYLRFFIKMGADADLLDDQDRNALIYAVMHRSEKCINELLAVTGRLDQKDKKGFDIALHCAISGTAQIARILAEHKLALDKVYPDDKTTLIFAAMAGNVEMVRYLVETGADMDAVDNKKRTALMYSSGNGHYKTTEALLEAGADTHCKDENGLTAKQLAKSTDVRELFETVRPDTPAALTPPPSQNYSERNPAPF